jgi:hypothetical protein
MADEDLEAVWAKVLDAWDDPAAHRRFLTLAAATRRLAFAGSRYRQVKESDPDPLRRQEADRRIDEILALAMSSLELEKTRPSRARSRIEWIAYGVSAVLTAAALLQLFRSIGSH